MHVGRPGVKQDSRYVDTSGWELCGSSAMSGLSEEPGRRYSGGAPSWLVVSVFVLLKERFRLFPLVIPESAVIKRGFSVSLIIFLNFVLLLSKCTVCVGTWCLCMCECLQYAW